MIVFFDGVCGLCNRVVDFLLAQDREGRLQFAPIQGSTARKMLSAYEIASLSTVVVIDGDRIFRKSDAVLHALSALGGSWVWLAKSARWVPQRLRDVVYRGIAINRYEWFGRRDTCRLPTPAERARFLD